MKFEDNYQVSKQTRGVKSFQAEGVELQRHESMLEHGISGRIAGNSERLGCVKNKGEN